MSREEYQAMISNAEFETLSYEDYSEIFKLRLTQHPTVSAEDHLQIVKKHDESYKKKALFYKLKNNIVEEEHENRFLAPMPITFDWRTFTPSCYYFPIKDQANCGSCYSFSSSWVLAKRFCLDPKNDKSQYSLDFSPQDILTCDITHNKCEGGVLPHVWEYLEKEGVATENCKPYTAGVTGYVGTCLRFCDSYSVPFKRYKAQRYSMETKYTNDEIKRMIYYSGPVSTAMDAYEDMSSYRGGIYRPMNIGKPEGHAVSLLGWGYDYTTKTEYWIAANSWGNKWGEDGYFKHPFNVNRIGMFGIASKPELN